MAKEMTKKEKFGLAIEMAKANGNEMLVEFFKHEVELLEKKRSNGNSKANEKMERSMEVVYCALEKVGSPVPVTELIASSDLSELANESGIVTTQKVSAYLNKLVERGRVTKFTEKKKTYFAVAETDGE